MLRAKSNVRGEGWTMEVVVGDQVIGVGRNARRGVAGETALSTALQNVQAHFASATASSKNGGGGGLQHGDNFPSTKHGFTVIGEFNMSGTERELLGRLCELGLPAPPQLRAKRNPPRGEDGWTMEVTINDAVLSSAQGSAL